VTEFARKKRMALPLVLAVIAGSSTARAEHRRTLPTPTLIWAVTQFIPSPGINVIRQDPHFTLNWQVTPLLYSFGVRREVNPWRFLIAEPLVRQGGSIEIFVSPEYTSYPGTLSDKWGIRAGIRSYFPIVEHGEGLSLSLGGSHLYFHGEHSVGFEAGAYVLFGFLGLQMTYTPKLLGTESWMTSVHIRYF
jgi:hypothetical protein